MNFLILGLILILVILLIVFFMASYIKCPPDMVYLISGLKKESKVITGKATIRIPFLERIDKVPLKLIQIDVKANSSLCLCPIINNTSNLLFFVLNNF